MAEGSATHRPNKRELDKNLRAAIKHFRNCTCKTKEQAHSARIVGPQKKFRIGGGVGGVRVWKITIKNPIQLKDSMFL